jgi:Protein of unknown function (DUF4239)
VGSFVILFSLITAVSVLISGALLLIRRKGGGRWRRQEHIQSSVFNFFTTLYAFVIGFAIVTLWSAFLTAKTNVTREAESMINVYRTAKHLPNSGPFCQAVSRYVKTVINVEWAEMEKGVMSPEAEHQFEAIWSRYDELGGDSNRLSEVRSNLTEAGRLRSLRSTMLTSNLYPPIWVILLFGLISVIYGLYFINREPTVVSLIYEFMVIFLVLSCLYFIYDLDTPFSGWIILKPDALQIIHLKMISLG